MTQQECLALPTHWTHYGVCYAGNATIQIHSADPVAVPEPTTGALLMLAMTLGAIFARRNRHA